MIYKNLKLLSLFIATALLAGCNWFSVENKQEEPKLIIVNVNEVDSFNDCHISGSINLPYEQIVSDSNYLKNKTSNWNKASDLVIYCIDYACTASHEVAKKLMKMGFQKVRVYSGGIQEWYQLAQNNKNDYPYFGAAVKPYLKRDIQKIESKDAHILVVTATDLSKLIQSSKNLTAK